MPDEIEAEDDHYTLGKPRGRPVKLDYHGSILCERIQPALEVLRRTDVEPGKKTDVESVRIDIGFDGAMHLAVAIQSAVQDLIRYDRRTGMGVRLSIMGGAIQVFHTNIKSDGE